MSLFTKKAQPEPTAEDRMAAADNRINGAMGLFTGLADDLDRASAEHASASDELAAEADRLTLLAMRADDQAYDAQNFADRIRSFVG